MDAHKRRKGCVSKLDELEFERHLYPFIELNTIILHKKMFYESHNFTSRHTFFLENFIVITNINLSSSIKGRGRFFVDDHASKWRRLTTWPPSPTPRYQLVYNRKRKTNPDRSLQLATSANHRPLCRAARTQKKAGRKRSGGVGQGWDAF